MDGWMDGRMDGWVGGWMDGWVGGWMGGWVDGWMDGWVGGWMDGWMLRISSGKHWKYMENCFWENRRSQELRLRPFARFARSHKIWEYGDMGILSISNGLYDQQI